MDRIVVAHYVDPDTEVRGWLALVEEPRNSQLDEAVERDGIAFGNTELSWWRELVRTPGDMAIATPVFGNPWLLISGLMLKLDADKPAAAIIWPDNKVLSKRVLSNKRY